MNGSKDDGSEQIESSLSRSIDSNGGGGAFTPIAHEPDFTLRILSLVNFFCNLTSSKRELIQIPQKTFYKKNYHQLQEISSKITRTFLSYLLFCWREASLSFQHDVNSIEK